MRTNWLVISIAMLIAILGIATIACSDDDAAGDGNGGSVGAAGVIITSPENGAEVTSPVPITIVAQGIVIAPASDGQPGAKHYVVAADDAIGKVVLGQVVGHGLESQGIYHVAAGTVDLELEPGIHTVSVNLADNGDVLTDASLATVTFTVVE